MCAARSTESDIDCTDGEVRLMNGTNTLEGRLEVCINRAWGTVCSADISEDEATVICSQLGVVFNGECIKSVIVLCKCKHWQHYSIIMCQ